MSQFDDVIRLGGIKSDSVARTDSGIQLLSSGLT